MRKSFLTAIVFILLCSLFLTSFSYAKEATIKEKTQSHYNNAQPIDVIGSLEKYNCFKEEILIGHFLTQEELEEVYEKEEQLYLNTATDIPEQTFSYGLSEEQIDMITNVVMHEVGGLSGINITLVYANGTTIDYSGTNFIHKVHARVLLNQYNSSLFPSSLSKCISYYWASYLANSNYYSHNNETWKTCRQDVLEELSSGPIIPNNVFGATCDPYFASYYPGYSLYATIYWNTGWYSGVFYYYQYNG